MKLANGTLLAFMAFTQFGQAQVNHTSNLDNALEVAPAVESPPESYAVIGATPEQESTLREQVGRMHPPIFPSRVVFVPRWKYQDATRTFRLHVPSDMSSVMFTHLASRTVFINIDRYLGSEWLGYWMAHELGHLATSSTREDDAERAAHGLRKRLRDTR